MLQKQYKLYCALCGESAKGVKRRESERTLFVIALCQSCYNKPKQKYCDHCDQTIKKTQNLIADS